MIQFNDKLEVTDHDLSQMANRWAKLLPNEDIGIRTSFAHGFKAALSEVKKLNKSDVSNRRELLLDFLSEVNGNLITHPHLQMSTRFVDDYLKSNNCC